MEYIQGQFHQCGDFYVRTPFVEQRRQTTQGHCVHHLLYAGIDDVSHQQTPRSSHCLLHPPKRKGLDFHRFYQSRKDVLQPATEKCLRQRYKTLLYEIYLSIYLFKISVGLTSLFNIEGHVRDISLNIFGNCAPKEG